MMRQTKKNPAAVALGRRGGKVRSAAQVAVSKRSDRGQGRPLLSLPCRVCGASTVERDASRRPYDGCAYTLEGMKRI